MPDINPVSKNDDLSRLEITLLDWDCVCHGEEYQVVRINGKPHSCGGRRGFNEYYCYPLGKEMIVDNLVEFSGEAPLWGIRFDRHNYIKHGWHDTEMLYSGRCFITRNGKDFYEVNARDHEYALAKAQYQLVQLQEECPLSFGSRDWWKKEIGRKVWYREQPAIIERFILDQGCMILKPDGFEYFAEPRYHTAEDKSDPSERRFAKCTYLSESIWWFRDSSWEKRDKVVPYPVER